MLEAAGIVIVGGGQAGGRAARAARDAGYDGPVTLVAAEAHLPYERPPLSKALLLDATAATPFLFTQEIYEEKSIKVLVGCRVTTIERASHRLVLSNGTSLPYAKLLLATGCKARPFEIEGLPREDLLSLRSIDESRAIEGRLRPNLALAVVGGGFIGLEVAASAARRGCAVTVIEAAPRLLPRLGCPEVSAAVFQHHSRNGIRFHLGARISAARKGRIVLESGLEIPVNLTVFGIGVVPDTELATNAGLDVYDGILIDEFGQTSDPDIFAAGDVTRHYNPLLKRCIRLESWENANLQAIAAARTMIGQPTIYAEIPWLWSDQGALNLQAAGAPETVDAVMMRGNLEEGMSVFQLKDDKLVGALTVNRAKDMPIMRRMLAAPALALSVSALADPSIPLRRFLPVREAV